MSAEGFSSDNENQLVIDEMMAQDKEKAIVALENAGAKVERNGDDTTVEATAEQVAAAKKEMEASA
jgi:hypothetical protein